MKSTTWTIRRSLRCAAAAGVICLAALPASAGEVKVQNRTGQTLKVVVYDAYKCQDQAKVTDSSGCVLKIKDPLGPGDSFSYNEGMDQLKEPTYKGATKMRGFLVSYNGKQLALAKVKWTKVGTRNDSHELTWESRDDSPNDDQFEADNVKKVSDDERKVFRITNTR